MKGNSNNGRMALALAGLPSYPRTLHLEGSKGRLEKDQVKIADLKGRYLVVEEKLDGSQVSIGFDGEGFPILQNRNSPINQQDPEFAYFKSWFKAREVELYEVLGSRYALYGEWLYAKHTVYYDQLPDYFFEYDLLDLSNGQWLSTPKRKELLSPLNLEPVPVLYAGEIESQSQLKDLIKCSRFKSPNWKESLVKAGKRLGISSDQLLKGTDSSSYSEGLYLKAESPEYTQARFKFIRPDFLNTILDSGSHWKERPLVPNSLSS